MKSTFIKESKNVLPTVLFEFNPTAKIERKNIATKRPLSATAASHSKYNNFFPTNKENKNSNNLIKVSKIFKTAFEKLKPNSEKKDISLSKFNPTFKKLKQNPEFSSNHQLIKDLQNKFITTEKIPKYAANNQLQNTQVQQDAISNFEDDTIIKENKLTSKVLDFETIFNKFMESDETVVKKENLKKDEIKTEIHEKLLDSFEFFLDKFEKEGVKKKTPIQIPLKKPNEPPIKKMEYISKNFEGKTSGEVFQHFKKKFKISEILLKNLQQIKEIKQNFKLIKNTAIEEKNSGKAPSELEQIKPQTKQINTQDSFEDVRETTINKEKTKTEINKYQSNAAQVIKLQQKNQ